MRALPVAFLAACSHASPPPQVPPAPATDVVFEGTVTDQFSKPIAGADVLLCERDGPCRFIEDRAAWSADRLPILLASPDLAQRAEHATATTTDATGHWRVRLPHSKADQLDIVLTTAPGWTIGAAIAPSVSWANTPLAPDKAKLFELRPARAFDLVPTCTPAPCPAQMNPTVMQHGRRVGGFLHGTHVDHFPIGTYDVELTAGYGKPGEQRGTLTIDTSIEAAGYPIVLAPTGTGLAITGTVTSNVDRPITVDVACGDVRRSVVADKKTGSFRLDDVGKPPCRVEALAAPEDDHERVETQPVSVDHLPATVKLEVSIERWEE